MRPLRLCGENAIWKILKMTDIKRLDSREPGFREALEQLLTREAEADRRVEAAVQEIIAAVQNGLQRDMKDVPKLNSGQSLSPEATAIADLLRVLLKAAAARHRGRGDRQRGRAGRTCGDQEIEGGSG